MLDIHMRCGDCKHVTERGCDDKRNCSRYQWYLRKLQEEERDRQEALLLKAR